MTCRWIHARWDTSSRGPFFHVRRYCVHHATGGWLWLRVLLASSRLHDRFPFYRLLDGNCRFNLRSRQKKVPWAPRTFSNVKKRVASTEPKTREMVSDYWWWDFTENTRSLFKLLYHWRLHFSLPTAKKHWHYEYWRSGQQRNGPLDRKSVV